MAVRSVIDIDVNDQNFQTFQATFAKYQAMLAQTPAAWAQVNKTIGAGLVPYRQMVALEIASIAKAELMNKAHAEAIRLTRNQNIEWGSIYRYTRGAAGNIAGMTHQLLKWTALTTVFSGLIGVGGLFGIERLAGNVAAGRRSSGGLGVSYGEQKSFGLNFSRLVDPDSFLGSVNEAQHDVTKRAALYGAGLREKDITGRSSAELGSQLLTQLKGIVDKTPEAQLAQTLQARRLDQFIGLQDAQRLKNMSPAELVQLQASFKRDQGSLGLSPINQRTWTDFSNQMGRAGGMIENTFVKGLSPLIPALSSLSASVTRAVESFLAAPKLKEWITDLGVGLEKAATYLGSDDFQEKVQRFIRAFGEVAETVVKVSAFLGSSVVRGAAKTTSFVYRNAVNPWAPEPKPENPDDLSRKQSPFAPDLSGRTSATGGAGAPALSGRTPAGVGTPDPASRAPLSERNNNPGNLRPPGASSGFQTFATPDEGYKAMARQLKLYQDRDKLQTVSQIISKWAPPSENDTQAYIGDVATRSGLGTMGKIDLNDPDQMSRLIAAMATHENSRNRVTPAQVKITLYGAPGGNTIANAQQAAQ